MHSLELMRESVEKLLRDHGEDAYSKEILAPLIARKSLEMNHLYEDLGFHSRSEMGRFMMRYFPSLARLKPKDKLWNNLVFIYDCIDATAPACALCDDQVHCFRCNIIDRSAS